MTGRLRSPRAHRLSAFGRYLLLERIAVGGMAEVYLAKRFDPAVSNLMAIKRIKPALAENDEFIRMFLDEAKIAGRLSHPGIARILELGRVGRSHYLAMDFVWGKDLLQIMRRMKLLGAQLGPSFVAWIGVGMLDALEHAHRMTDRHGEAMGLIHRDVSPQNVLLGFDGVVKLIDFGIAKAQSRNTETRDGVLKGKVGYMSPEQVRGAEIDPRSDIFAVGTCLYELLTLRTLFARENAFLAMENVRHVRAQPLRALRADVPEPLAEILLRAHAATPEQRWPSAGAMAAALRVFLKEHDPAHDRAAARRWMRDAFRKELVAERRRLLAFDLLGRPQVLATEPGSRRSIADLAGRDTTPSPPTHDVVEDPSHERAPHLDPPRGVEPHSEVYFHRPDDLDVSLEPSQIDSAMIQQLLPSREEIAEETRRPTRRSQTPEEVSRPAQPPRPDGGWLSRTAAALLLVGLGAAGFYAFSESTKTETIEVRTVPAVDAQVLLDGVRRGTAPLRLEDVGPGRHVVTLVASGYRDAERTLHVTSESTVMVEIMLVPVEDP